MLKKFSVLMVFVGLMFTGFVSVPAAAVPVGAMPTLDEQNESAAEVMAELEESDEPLEIEEIEAVKGLGPPPWTSFGFEHSEEAVEVWVEIANQLPSEELQGKRSLESDIKVEDREEPGEVGENDSAETAQPISNFGTESAQSRGVEISGNLSGGQERPPLDFDCESSEDDGSISQANDIDSSFGFGFCGGVIGDGPFGETSGDVDFFSFGEVEEGSTISFDVAHVSDSLNPVSTVIGIYDADGTLLTSLEDDGTDFDDFGIELSIDESGVYYGAVAGCCELSADPFNSASGKGKAETGTYELFTGIETPPCVSVEDDGSIGKANETPLLDQGPGFAYEMCTGEIGDGPFGETSGDVDFFKTNEIEAGNVLTIDLYDEDNPDANSEEFVLGVYDSQGNLVATGQDSPDPEDFDFFQTTIEETGEYYVSIGGGLPDDPKDSSTGTDNTTTGTYTVFIVEEPAFDEEPFDDEEMPVESEELRAKSTEWRNASSLSAESKESELRTDLKKLEKEEPVDTDFYGVDLKKGDTISGGFDNARTVGIVSSDGTTVMASTFNPSFIYPADSPLRHDRRNGFDHVAADTGTYFVYVTDGLGEYEGELNVVRSGLADAETTDQQIIFVDFDGATVTPSTFAPGFGDEEPVDLSPMKDFLTKWGLNADDEDAVIDSTIDAVIENLDTDLRVEDGRNGDRDQTGQGTQFDVEVLNSRDHEDPWGQKNVSRLIIGGTIDQLTIPTIGIAESIDPGNTDTEESAVILLDLLSEDPELSLGQYEVAPGSSTTEFVGHAIGHIASHEAGHYLGSYHTDVDDGEPSLMDQGGDFESTFGVGPDRIFGTEDDIDADFVTGPFAPYELFEGEEDTAARTGFGLSTGKNETVDSANFVARVKGDTGEEQFEVRVDGQVLATGTARTDWTDFAITLPVNTALSDIQLAFTNDAYIKGSYDRNLYVDYVEFEGQRYESEAPTTFGTGTWTQTSPCLPGFPQSEVLHCNGYFQYEQTPPSEDPIPFTTRIKGTTGDELFAIEHNGQVVGHGQATTDWTEHEITVPPGSELSQIQVFFLNDAVSDSYDRNLRIDYVDLDGQQFESEAPTTFGTGTWQSDSRCKPGFLESEVLHCNGYFQYN